MFVSSSMLRGLRVLFSCPCFSRVALFDRRFLCTAQTLEEEDDTEVLSKRELMQQEAFTEQQIKAVLDMDPRSDKLALILILLKDRGITGPDAGSFIAAHPRLMRGSRSLTRFRLRLEVFEHTGMDPELLKKAILKKSSFLSCSGPPEKLEKNLSFLKDFGLSPHAIYLTVMRSPSFLNLGIDSRLKPRCELFYKRGISKESVCQLIRNYPRAFSVTNATILQKLDLIEKIGLDLKTKAGARALGLWSTCSDESLLDKFEVMKSLGMSHEEAVTIVKTQPNVLCMRKEKIRKKIEFAFHTLNVGVETMIKSPCYFTCSLEKRIMPRFTIVLGLKEKGLLTKPLPFGSIVSASDREFEKRFKT